MAEQRLIDANELKTAFPCGESVRTECVRATIDQMPTIEERKKGKWIDKGAIPNYPEEGFNNYHLLVCDQCGCMHRTTVWCVNEKYINADFCPNCGALMR